MYYWSQDLPKKLQLLPPQGLQHLSQSTNKPSGASPKGRPYNTNSENTMLQPSHYHTHTPRQSHHHPFQPPGTILKVLLPVCPVTERHHLSTLLWRSFRYPSPWPNTKHNLYWRLQCSSKMTLDRRNPSIKYHKPKTHKYLTTSMLNHALVDPWRTQHPNAVQFSWDNKISASRIDFALVSTNL